MLHSGHNEIEGVPVEVVRKRIRRINIRVAADGTVCLSVPKWWAARVGEEGVSWKVRKVRSLWGCCHWRDRYITYNAELARAPRNLVEYVVAHEYTHFAVHNHGPRFYALMDERLPGWQTLRRRLNRREWGETRQNAPQPPCAAPEPVAAPTVAPPASRVPAAPAAQAGAKGRKPTFVQTEFWE